MRIYLDTNVLVSALATRGLCADLVETVLMEHELVAGPAVLAELEKVLTTKLKMPPARCAEVVDFLKQEAAPLVENARAASCDADKDDCIVLGEALAGQAQVFVTGDAALTELGRVEAMSIVTPRQLWELLRTSAQ